jgi:hypothetical protein
MCAALIFQCVIANASFAGAGPYIPEKYKIMAGYLLHLPSYIYWPVAQKVTNICIVGTDPFGRFIDEMIELRAVKNEVIPVIAKRLAVGAEIGDCHLVFVSRNDVSPVFWDSIPANRPLLLVSDDPDFTRQGGIISFYNENNRIRMEINLARAREIKLDISSRLLKLVRIVLYPNERSCNKELPGRVPVDSGHTTPSRSASGCPRVTSIK